MYLLLSPAKNLNEKDAAPNAATGKPVLLEQSATIAHALKKLDAIDIQELMSVSAKIAETNVLRNQAWQVDFDDSAKPAVYLFDGDAYKGLDAYALPNTAIDYLQSHLGMLSGLYGLVKPLDAIMPYRLEMGTKLAVGDKKDLYDFWGDAIANVINENMASSDSKVLVNLASNEYFKAVNTKKIPHSIITPKFLDQKNGDYKMISFFAKRARGLMVRFAAMNALTDANDLKAFDLEGYYFDEKRSSDKEWVFLRDEV